MSHPREVALCHRCAPKPGQDSPLHSHKHPNQSASDICGGAAGTYLVDSYGQRCKRAEPRYDRRTRASQDRHPWPLLAVLAQLAHAQLAPGLQLAHAQLAPGLHFAQNYWLPSVLDREQSGQKQRFWPKAENCKSYIRLPEQTGRPEKQASSSQISLVTWRRRSPLWVQSMGCSFYNSSALQAEVAPPFLCLSCLGKHGAH